MVNDEGPADNFVNALKFSVSNVASLAIWGIGYVVALFVSVFIMVFAWLFLGDNLLLLIIMFVVAFLPALALSILLLGFFSQCIKTALDGGSRMPTGFESPGALVKDGVMTFIIVMESAVLELICFVPGFLLLFMASSDDSAMRLAGMALIMLAFPVILVILFLNVIQWAVYADTGSLLRGLNPLKPVSLILSNPGGAIVTVVSVIAAYMLMGIVGFVCELTIVGMFLIPFLTIATYACIIYLIAVFYRQSCGDRFGDIQDSVTAGYSVS